MDKQAKLFALMAAHPELPVVPMVDSDIVADDGCMRWLGSWGDSDVREYVLGNERVCFRDDDDIEGALAEVIGYDAYSDMTDAEAQQAYLVGFVICIYVI